jgi:hypothetical protein
MNITRGQTITTTPLTGSEAFSDSEHIAKHGITKEEWKNKILKRIRVPQTKLKKEKDDAK